MSCPERTEDLDSSDYGSDFTPDEEDLLNTLLSKAVAEHATDATPTHTWLPTPTPIERTTAPKTPDLTDLDSLQPAVPALVADIEDGIEPVVRLPKVLGREGPRSPWRQSQPRPAVRWNPTATGRSSPRASNRNRSSPLGMPSPPDG